MIIIFKSLIKNIIWSFSITGYLKFEFFWINGYWPNTKNPQTFKEHLFVFKLNSGKELSYYVDKLSVRRFVKKNIAQHNLKKLKLPKVIHKDTNIDSFVKKVNTKKCVIKTNHGSGKVFYNSPSRGRLTSKDINLFRKWIKTNHYNYTGERYYSFIKPIIFAEELLQNKDGSNLIDIKVHCFYGTPAIIQLIDRSTGLLKRKTFDENWKEKSWFKGEDLEFDSYLIPKNEVLRYSKILSSGFEFVRVDFYLLDDSLYFSELTFCPSSSHLPLKSYEIDCQLGRLCIEPKKSVT